MLYFNTNVGATLMPHLVALVEQLRHQGIGFRSIGDDAIDTTTASRELVFHIFSALAQFERRLIQERTRAGLSAARALHSFISARNLKMSPWEGRFLTH